MPHFSKTPYNWWNKKTQEQEDHQLLLPENLTTFFSSESSLFFSLNPHGPHYNSTGLGKIISTLACHFYKIVELFSGCVPHVHIIHSIAPITILKHFLGQ